MEDSEILKALYAQNHWWEGKPSRVPAQKRREFFPLKKALGDRQVTAILGPRRVGKSVLMQQLISGLLEEGTPPKQILFAQLDDPKFGDESGLAAAKILETYFQYVLGIGPQELKSKAYIFLDEVQVAEKWGEVLKSYYDQGHRIKFTVSGSSAAGITKGSSESLAGRVGLHLVLTLKFADYLKFRGAGGLDGAGEALRQKMKDALEGGSPDALWKSLKKLSAAIVPRQDAVERLLGEYMVKGGYIELVEQPDYAKCLQYLKDLLQLVIYRDIVKVFGVRNPKNMEDLLLFLGNHSGELFSEAGTASKLGIKNQTASEYLGYLEDTFLVDTTMAYAANRSKQIRNPKKIYLSDNGMRNMLNGTYSQKALADSRDVGLMAETVAHNHLLSLAFFLEPHNAKCFYWKNGGEIDNVVVFAKKAVPVEVKYKNSIGAQDTASCYKFMEENASPFGLIITKNRLDYRDKLFYIPLWYFLLMC